MKKLMVHALAVLCLFINLSVFAEAPRTGVSSVPTDSSRAINREYYRIQAGSYKIAKHATEAFKKLEKKGLNVAFEKYEDAYRVVVIDVDPSSLETALKKIEEAGFSSTITRKVPPKP